jgi:NAD(P)-dependent dehydrogenase (short-subunit alcohol dehydrogenase family)
MFLRSNPFLIVHNGMPKLSDRVIFITGASKGIGLGCALVCLRHGAKIALIARDPFAAEPELVAAGFPLGDDVLALSADVRDPKAMEAAISRSAAHFGHLDGVINNAGWHPPAMTIEETSLADFESLLKLNLTSTFLGCKYAVPYLRKTRGAIVNVSSEVALIGQDAAPAYVATKAGQLGLTRALALDLARDGVRVNAVCPAGVMTPLMREWAGTQYDPEAALKLVDSWHPLGRMATVEEIGEVCAFLLSAEASFITGQAICPDGGAALGYRR